MTATSQHGFHPDAESLSAFSEQALQERERADVLAHLAVCGRCRQVVALARKAADAEAVAPVAPRKTVAPNAWWKQWRLVWIPAAVAVAFAVTTISVYIENVDRHGPEIKIAEQNPTQGVAPAATPAPTEQAEAVPPAPAISAPPLTHTAKHAHSAAEEPMPAPAPPLVTTQMPSEFEAPAPTAPDTRATDQVEAMRDAQPRPHAEAMPAPPELTAGAMRPAYAQPASGAWEEKQQQPEQQRQAEVDTPRVRAFKSKAAPAAVHEANAAPPGGAAQTATVTTAPPLETQPAAEPALTSGTKSPRDVATPPKPMPLPSGLAVVSFASGGHFLLAIDKAGTLFLSEDHGITWERVTTQWTGRAVAVRRQGQFHGALYVAPAAQNGTGTGGSSGDAGLAPSPAVFFELSNDKNQTWVSTDGRTWTSK
jgi:hypothetical protein